MKKDTRNESGGWIGFVLFYLLIGLAFLLTSSLGGCARPQPVVVDRVTEPPRPEFMQPAAVPKADKTEPDDLKRCVKNLAATRQGCGKIADQHNGLVAYEKKRQQQEQQRRVQ